MTPSPTDDVWESLYTTRAMRRMAPDPIPDDVRARIFDAAIRAPRGGNKQRWRFVLVDDPATMATLGRLYREATAQMWAGPYASEIAAVDADPQSPRAIEFRRLQSSVQYLADHFHEVPLLVFAFARNDPAGASVMPAVWSAMLAARALGVGTALSSVLEDYQSVETFELLGVPQDRGWRIAATIAFGYPLGRWGVAPRQPAHEVLFQNRWGIEASIRVDEPLWPRP